MCAARTDILFGRVGTKCTRGGIEFRFLSPVHRLDQLQAGGDLGEHCSSPAVGRGVYAPPGRVAQPRLLAAGRGEPRRGGKLGRRFLDYFLWPYKESNWRAGPYPATLTFVIHASTGSARTALNTGLSPAVLFLKLFVYASHITKLRQITNVHRLVFSHLQSFRRIGSTARRIMGLVDTRAFRAGAVYRAG